MRYLLTSWGSRGDLHPFLALGRGLLALGHAVTLVGHPDWGEETAAAGLRFVGTNEPPRDNFLQRHPEIFSRRWGGLASLRALVHHGMVPGFDGMLAALRTEAETHDVLVAHHFVFPAPIAAELTGRPWATVSLAPGVVPSAYARPGAQFGRTRTGPLARQIHRLTWISGQEITRRVVDPVVNRLRARHGLAPIRDAVFDAHSARLNLQLYSDHFAPRPPDWSAEKRYGGFCFYDPPDEPGLAPKLEEFLGAGEPPVLVTLGSAAVQLPGSFYRDAAGALVALGLRGILLTGPEENRPARLPGSILALPYAAYGPLMPRVRAVVHQCGIGTLSHALRAGIPSVGCPFAFDQPNNARRLEALGVAEVLLPHRRGARAMAEALGKLLAGEAPATARALGAKIRAEDGVGRSCAVLEEVFGGSLVRDGGAP
jgi:UDP:flavonoid glycosyltransferase YjiC (YdhE family)